MPDWFTDVEETHHINVVPEFFKENSTVNFYWKTLSECVAEDNDFEICVKLSDKEIIKNISGKESEKTRIRNHAFGLLVEFPHSLNILMKNH